jgi:hypothetical protein
MDPHEVYQIGERPYLPDGARWLAYDSVPNSRDPNGLTAFGGDGVNYWDAWGTLPNNLTEPRYPIEESSVLETFLGDITTRADGSRSIYTGGIVFFAPDVWPENNFGDIAPGTGLGFSSGDPRQQIFADLNRARNIAVGVGYTVGGFIPWVGDALDVGDVVSPGSSGLERTFGGVSLGANVLTAGALPNAGPIRRGIDLIGDAFDARRVVSYLDELSLTSQAARRHLREAVPGTGGQAHHIVPWEARTHELVERAARGGFNINGANNGIRLDVTQHFGPHSKYNEAVMSRLDSIFRSNPGISDDAAAAALQGYADQLRSGLIRSSNRLQ